MSKSASKWPRRREGLTANAALCLSGGSKESALSSGFLGLEMPRLGSSSGANEGESGSAELLPGRVKSPSSASSTTAFSEADTALEGREFGWLVSWEIGAEGEAVARAAGMGGSPSSEERLLARPCGDGEAPAKAPDIAELEIMYADGDTLGGGGGGAR